MSVEVIGLLSVSTDDRIRITTADFYVTDAVGNCAVVNSDDAARYLVCTDRAGDGAVFNGAYVVVDETARAFALYVCVEEVDVANRASVAAEQADINTVIDCQVADCVAVAVEGAREVVINLRVANGREVDAAQVNIVGENKSFARAGVATVYCLRKIIQIVGSLDEVSIAAVIESHIAEGFKAVRDVNGCAVGDSDLILVVAGVECGRGARLKDLVFVDNGAVFDSDIPNCAALVIFFAVDGFFIAAD